MQTLIQAHGIQLHRGTGVLIIPQQYEGLIYQQEDKGFHDTTAAQGLIIPKQHRGLIVQQQYAFVVALRACRQQARGPKEGIQAWEMHKL